MLTADDVKGALLGIGFQQVGICRADPPASGSVFQSWMNRDLAGSMSYMRRNLDIRLDPARLLPGVRSIVAVGLNYAQPSVHRQGYPRVARYALGRDYHRVLRSKLRRFVRSVHAQSPDAGWRICVDSAPILEREYAHRAGLGWFGKNTLLIDSRRGSWFVIALVLTTLDLEPDAPAIGGCGTCRACIDACPTGAIVQAPDGHWEVDARQCISYLTIEQPDEADARVGDWTFGCDVCQEVCPFNAPRESQPLRAAPTTESDFLTHSAIAGLSLERIERMTQREWDAATQGSPIRRAGYDGLRRVARINRAAREG